MHFSIPALLFSQFIIVNSQYLSCPLLGPDFPLPTDLQDDASITAAAQNLTAQLDALTTSTNLSTSFSVQWFTANSKNPLFEYHYTGPSVVSSSSGVKNITSDSVYRVGSIGKLYTIYLFLAEAGDQYFHRSITDFIPELFQAATASPGSSEIESTRWDDITIGSLASQISGIGRDDGQVDLLALHTPWTELGFPALTADELPACGFNASVPPCTRALFLEGLIKHQPVFAPFTSPIYSNNAFGLLSFALEAISNKSFSEMMENMYAQLNLTQTSYTTPSSDANGVIPWNVSHSQWAFDEASNNPAGSIYASTNDLSSFGRAILNSALISPTETRRWMKPLTFTSSNSLAVGAPWEIYRVPSTTNNYKITDYYTKGGDIGVYSSLLALLPDYNVGFSIFTADGSSADVAATLSNMVAETFGAMLEEAAKLQANASYSGIYTSSKDGSNSSVAINVDKHFGLGIQSWISDGADIFTDIYLTQGITSSPNHTILVQLVPTGLESINATSKITSRAFRAIFGLDGPAPMNVFNLNCATWTTLDALSYGGVSLDLFVFELDESGAVQGVIIPSLHTSLVRL